MGVDGSGGDDESRFFIVRVWQQTMRGFRASVRSPGDEAPRLFTEPAQVASFLAAQSRTGREGDGRDDPEPESPSR